MNKFANNGIWNIYFKSKNMNIVQRKLSKKQLFLIILLFNFEANINNAILLH